jgi:hypothetical protein
MKLLQFGALALGSVGLLVFGAFSQSDRATSYASSLTINREKSCAIPQGWRHDESRTGY